MCNILALKYFDMEICSNIWHMFFSKLFLYHESWMFMPLKRKKSGAIQQAWGQTFSKHTECEFTAAEITIVRSDLHRWRKGDWPFSAENGYQIFIYMSSPLQIQKFQSLLKINVTSSGLHSGIKDVMFAGLDAVDVFYFCVLHRNSTLKINVLSMNQLVCLRWIYY